MRVAALTMAYNEPFFTPIWVHHYARQLGPQNCFLIDHGSDDGSTEGLPVHVLRLPRSTRDEELRARRIRATVADLLTRYDAVVHADIDELLLADPFRFANLAEYAAAAPEVVTAFGLELQHLPEEEAAYDPARPPGAQRRWVRFAAAMSKPALVRRALDWTPGFHSAADAPLVLDALYLVHLRYVDLQEGLARLADTRQMAVADETANAHHRVADDAFEGMVRQVATLPRSAPGRFDVAEPPLLAWAHALHASRAEREGERYQVDLALAGDSLWELPAPFRAVL